ncbi:alpha/beta hydrolase [Microbacterium sp. GCS4]|uniref:alpha/beta hydrolase n=1 Tax=Microbacterium sp. GCS4 TaxID=1692239 RepID=UPI00068241DC|nr:alpha/beta hydrolase [Microbacterium sp. GCS4]
MSGLSIDHGGAISVDPDDLRRTARRLDAVAEAYRDARRLLARAYEFVVDTPGLSARMDLVGFHVVGERVEELRDECEDTIESTLLMADVYEYVELRVQWLMDERSAAGREAREGMRRLEDADARIPGMAADLLDQWRVERFEGLITQMPWGGFLGPVFLPLAFIGGGTSLGVVPRGAKLHGKAEPVSVAPVKASTPAGAPAGLEGAVLRIPEKRGAQVAVEKYSFAGGTSTYVVYIKGTQTFAPGDWGGRDPWDMKSNSELYSGRRSASYDATIAALEAAGARPGDQVAVVAHSQGGAVATYVAMQSEYDVPVVITAGSPIDPTLRDDQTLVTLGHTDDGVRALSGGGSPGGTGTADSITITREQDPGFTTNDVGIPHHLASYGELAAQADASGDPRIEELDAFWQRLDEAEVIERTEFRAERVAKED